MPKERPALPNLSLDQRSALVTEMFLFLGPRPRVWKHFRPSSAVAELARAVICGCYTQIWQGGMSWVQQELKHNPPLWERLKPYLAS